MKKLTSVLFASIIFASLFIVPALAQPDKVDGFVCPVLGGKAGMNGKSPKIGGIAGGYYTVVGPDVSIPEHATNSGFPSVEGSFGTPGDEGYTAIWNYDNAP
jgi:hypothetical protein